MSRCAKEPTPSSSDSIRSILQLPKSVRFNGTEERQLYYCNHCHSSFLDATSLSACGNPSCTNGMCTNCASGDICEKCYRSVWVAVADLLDQVVEEASSDIDYSSESVYSSEDEYYDALFLAWVNDAMVDAEAADFVSGDEEAMENRKANSQLGPEAVKLSEKFEQFGPLRVKLSVTRGGIVKSRLCYRRGALSR